MNTCWASNLINAVKTQRLTLIGFLILAVLVVSPARRSSGAQSACSRLDQSHPAQFISYESVSDSDVHLRLHNNASCPIIVETDDHAPLHSGAGRLVALHYLLHERRKKTTVAAYGWGDSVFTVEIGPNDSVTFMVPLARLKNRLDVAVPFVYVWEGDHVGAGLVGGVNHLVYFLSDDFPARRK
jgi:hypothetical protein